MKALWTDTVVAESDETVVIEGNHYFPPESIRDAHFEENDHTTTCPWKGQAYYYDLVANGTREKNAAWYYPDPSGAASEIEDHVAFYTDRVDVTE